MDRATKLAWALAVTYFLVAIGSALGNGTGPGGAGFLTHILWSYVLLFTGAFLGFWVYHKSRAPPEVETHA